MKFILHQFSVMNNKNGITLRCPVCRQLGTFEAISDQIIHVPTKPPAHLGHRRCPNHTCHAHVFVAWDNDNRAMVAYPPERIDFDASAIPENVVKAFEEAITCHANGAFTAAAIMVRRTLEDLCAEEKAEGENLKKRIAALASKVVLPSGLLDGLDNLRLLGNDAAHVEAKDYAEVGKEEVELAIEVTKEVLKAVYQLKDLVTRLEGLKKPETV